jgi:hypothetical protein
MMRLTAKTPRRQERQAEKNILNFRGDLGVLCVFAVKEAVTSTQPSAKARP